MWQPGGEEFGVVAHAANQVAAGWEFDKNSAGMLTGGRGWSIIGGQWFLGEILVEVAARKGICESCRRNTRSL